MNASLAVSDSESPHRADGPRRRRQVRGRDSAPSRLALPEAEPGAAEIVTSSNELYRNLLTCTAPLYLCRTVHG